MEILNFEIENIEDGMFYSKVKIFRNGIKLESIEDEGNSYYNTKDIFHDLIIDSENNIRLECEYERDFDNELYINIYINNNNMKKIIGDLNSSIGRDVFPVFPDEIDIRNLLFLILRIKYEVKKIKGGNKENISSLITNITL